METTNYSNVNGKRVRLLSASEERRLAARIRMGDERARNQLAEANLPRVISIAKKYRASGMEFSDLVSEGVIGLMVACDKFDPDKGRFSTCATQWIRQAIGRAIQNKARIIYTPCYLQERIGLIERMRSRLLAAGIEATTEEIARRLGLPVEKVLTAMAAMDAMSLDAPVQGPTSKTGAYKVEDGLIGAVADQAPAPHDAVLQAQQNRALESLLGYLSERERHVIERRTGLDGREPETLQAIANPLGLSREAIRQTEQSALRKLRRLMHETNLTELLAH